MKKFKVPSTTYHRILNGISILVMVGFTIYLKMIWRKIPDKIPAHYDFMGQVDRWGDKGQLLILPILGAILYINISVLECFPSIWNTGVKITEKNKERVYKEIKNLVSTEKTLMVCIFAYIAYVGSKLENLGIWFNVISLALVGGSIIFFVTRIYKVPHSEK